LKNILADGIKGAASGALVGASVAGIGAIPGAILGLGGGLVTGAVMEASGINEYIENTTDEFIRGLKNVYIKIKNEIVR